MRELRVVVVDDEPIARRGLVRLLQPHADVKVVGEGRNGREAVQLLRNERPDLVFLDVKMPDLDGFAVLRATSESGGELPVVVFVTAFDEYAVKAFDVHAVDYLVKPFSDARFEMTLARARGYVQQRQAAELASRLAGLLAETTPVPIPPAASSSLGATASAAATPELKLVANLGQRAQVVPVKEIDWVEAQDYCVLIHVGRASYLMRESIRSLQQRLESAGFLRVHRSAMVNVDRVRELRRPARGEWVVSLADGTELPVSRRNRAALLQTVDRLARPPS
jgi:two-component system LytT family response regulator